MLETPLHFSVSRDRAIAMIREEWPEFTEEQFNDLIDRKRIDWRFLSMVSCSFSTTSSISLRVYPKEVSRHASRFYGRNSTAQPDAQGDGVAKTG